MPDEHSGALPPAHAGRAPMPMSLDRALADVDRVFGIDRLLAREGMDVVAPYYVQSAPAYRRVHSQEGAMHMALCPEGRFSPEGYLAQVRAVADQIAATDAGNVVELGCGMGFNACKLAQWHPGVQVTGMDIVARNLVHARRAAAAFPNARFVEGNYEDPIAGPPHGEVDLAFAVETLCHAQSPAAVAANLSRWLRPGARVVVFDGFRRPDFNTAPADVILAARLFEITTAVTRGFWHLSDWKTAFETHGLTVRRSDDLTDQTLACIRHLQTRAARFFGGWKSRILPHLLPRHLIGNAVAGLLAPYAVQGADPTAGCGHGALCYATLVAEKRSGQARLAALCDKP